MVLTQAHPAASYVCRTGNITLRCQYDVTQTVLAIQWIISGTLTDPATIRGHNTAPPTSTYHEVVVDNYMNLSGSYSCAVVITGTILPSNVYTPSIESECLLLLASNPMHIRSMHYLVVSVSTFEDMCSCMCAYCNTGTLYTCV